MIIVYLLNFLLSVDAVSIEVNRRSFKIDYKKNQFLKDGKPFRYISGGIHYFRVPSIYWEDRLQKIRKAGLNAIQTYVAWNVHEPFEGDYRFSGQNDLVRFIKLAQANELLVILRPGPYICAEWDYGGFPYWVMKRAQKTVRTSASAYLKMVEKWISLLLRKMKPLLYENGGPIIAVQVENEYGSYGNDHKYMKAQGELFRKYLGDGVVLFTTDGSGDWFLSRGSVPSLYTTIDFGAGGDPAQPFKLQRKYQPHGPLVNSEYYTGWLDHWWEPRSRVNGVLVANSLDKMLALNASVNMYMFEGGTNFGFMNGANQGSKYNPQITSYDYDAPLSEAGDPTKKYFLIQKVVSKYLRIPRGPIPKPSPKAAYGKFHAKKNASLYSFLKYTNPTNSLKPLSFEKMDHPYGYILYSTSLEQVDDLDVKKSVLKIAKFHDRATILVDKVFQGVLDRNYNNSIKVPRGKALDILVENQGRVNYGGYLEDTAKGILSNVTYNGHRTLKFWKMYPINETTLLKGMHDLLYDEWAMESNRQIINPPAAFLFTFRIARACDTFLKLDALTKGFVMLNGFNLGRYWTPARPQRTLYVPKNVLKPSGENILIIFETDRIPLRSLAFVEFVDKPEFTN